jgi:D-alanine-D-alanine ligase
LKVGVIEIEIYSEYYDYNAKYGEGGSRHIFPARIPGTVRHAALVAAQQLWELLGCRDIARIDFRYDPTSLGVEGLFMLEVNTHPGLTRTSLLPEVAAASGLPFSRLVSDMVLRAADRGGYRFTDRAQG